MYSWELLKSMWRTAASASAIDHDITTSQQGWQSGRKARYETKTARTNKVWRTKWNTHLPVSLQPQQCWWRAEVDTFNCTPHGSGLREADGGNLVGACGAAGQAAAPQHWREVTSDQQQSAWPAAVSVALDGLSEYSGCFFTSSSFSCVPDHAGKGFLGNVVPVYIPTKEQNENDLRLLLENFNSRKQWNNNNWMMRELRYELKIYFCNKLRFCLKTSVLFSSLRFSKYP